MWRTEAPQAFMLATSRLSLNRPPFNPASLSHKSKSSRVAANPASVMKMCRLSIRSLVHDEEESLKQATIDQQSFWYYILLYEVKDFAFFPEVSAMTSLNDIFSVLFDRRLSKAFQFFRTLFLLESY
ncbi:hypothetical protein RvY_03203-3 [Ramazzottius varieornatus]|uniref:Uncharacterized protein n=1 Tax=Ramazzottius varieornatus TaxID=947166 RepID=A0A1D1UR09_RAMVA|nr:hypothetical protein RvY_03203-3 [Ramazzottius varieornatus]